MFEGVESGGSSTAAAWQQIPESSDLVLGRKYRAKFYLMGPYASDTPAKIKGAILAGAALNNALAERHFFLNSMVTVNAVETTAPDLAQRHYAFPTFVVTVDFTKTGPGTPVHLVVGIILALLIFAAGLAFVVTKREVFERVDSGARTIIDGIGFGLVPLALAAALVLYFLKR